MTIPSSFTPQLIPPLRHGGNLTQAIRQYGGQAEDWLDLSTGISPWPYTAPTITASDWHRLPEDPIDLLIAAANYYGCQLDSITLTPGSQLAIRLIPTLIDQPQSIAMPSIGYQEHRHSWQSAGHTIIDYQDINELQALLATNNVQINNVVVINPNNPSTEIATTIQLRSLANQLSGLLIIDEAFADLNNENSLSADPNLENIIVLRSIGKFFGLAGARVGFVITQHPIKQRLTHLLSPWSINAPAQKIAELALNNQDWQQQQRLRIQQQSLQLNNLLNELLDKLEGNFTLHSQGLFSTIIGNHSSLKNLHITLAKHQIWTRLGDPHDIDLTKNWLRFSLPAKHLSRLTKTFNKINNFT